MKMLLRRLRRVVLPRPRLRLRVVKFRRNRIWLRLMRRSKIALGEMNGLFCISFYFFPLRTLYFVGLLGSSEGGDE